MSETADAPDIPRTYTSGPSDPVCFDDGAGTWVEVAIAAPAERVWEAVTDIDLPARFSEEYQGGEWRTEERGLGASFVGRNRHERIGEWEVESWMIDYEEGRRFGWGTSDPDNPGAQWTFTVDPIDEATTRLRYSLILGPGPSGLTHVIEKRPDMEARFIEARVEEHHANMTRVVEGIKAVLESGGPDSSE